MRSYVLQLRKVAVVAVDGWIVVAMTITPIEQPAVLLGLLTTTQTTLMAGTMHQPISPLCLTLEWLMRILDTRLLVAQTMCMQ